MKPNYPEHEWIDEGDTLIGVFGRVDIYLTTNAGVFVNLSPDEACWLRCGGGGTLSDSYDELSEDVFEQIKALMNLID